MFVFDVISVLVQLSEAREGSPLNNLQLPLFLLFLLPKHCSHPFFPTFPWPPTPTPVKCCLMSSWAFCALRPNFWLVCRRYLWMLHCPPGPSRPDSAGALCMGIGDHGRAAGAGLCSQPADGECRGRWGPQRLAPASPSCIASPCGLLLQ